MTEQSYTSASNDDLEREARRWDAGEVERRGWREAPEAIPRAGASTLISLRVPARMLEILKAFAQREGVGYQVLMKRWLDERILRERDAIARYVEGYQAQPESGEEAALSEATAQRALAENPWEDGAEL